MIGPIPIIAATHDRAAVGRVILSALAGTLLSSGILLLLLVDGFATPATSPSGMSRPGNTLVFPASANGQCHVDLRIGGMRLRGALADSGADGYLTLGRNQARQAGIDIKRLQFSGTYDSANGRARFAETRVPQVRIADTFDLADLPVAVTEVDQRQALVGIQVLQSLNFRLRGDRCELSSGQST